MTPRRPAQRLLALDHILILTHRRPDGDTIGCAQRLCLALRQKGKTAWLLPNEDAHHLFDPYLEGVLAPADFVPQAVVAVDVAALGMLPDSAQPYRDRIDLAIDHHGSQEGYAGPPAWTGQRPPVGRSSSGCSRPWRYPSLHRLPCSSIWPSPPTPGALSTPTPPRPPTASPPP